MILSKRPHRLSVKTVVGGGYDPDTGMPVPATSVWSDPVPCRFQTEGRDNLKTFPDGTYKIYPYVVYLDNHENVDYEGKTVRLYDQSGNLEFEGIVQKQPVRQVNTILYL